MLPAVTSTHNVPPASQPPGATPIHNVSPASQPSGSATPVHNVALASLPSGSATPVHNAPPASQQSNPTTEYSLWTQEAQPLATPVRVQESDIRDDFCQDFILKHLQELAIAHHEVMFILSQLHFGSYLNKPSYASAAAQFPRPINLDPCYREGDFDVLVIHRHYGILIGELKVVGMNQVDLRQSQGKADLNVAKKVRQAVKQLSKSETVLKHLISDIAPGLSVRKTLFLPFVSTAQLQRVLTADPQLEQVHTCWCARRQTGTTGYMSHIHTLKVYTTVLFCSHSVVTQTVKIPNHALQSCNVQSVLRAALWFTAW